MLSSTQKNIVRLISSIAVGSSVSKALHAIIPIKGPIDTMVSRVGVALVSNYVTKVVSDSTVDDVEEMYKQVMLLREGVQDIKEEFLGADDE